MLGFPKRPAPVVARAPAVNPDHDDRALFSVYRADAIARDVEQRRAEGRGAHPQHDALLAEALARGWAAVAAGLWKPGDVTRLQARLEG